MISRCIVQLTRPGLNYYSYLYVAIFDIGSNDSDSKLPSYLNYATTEVDLMPAGENYHISYI